MAWDPGIWTTTVEGIVIGVTAGLLLKLIHIGSSWCYRREQIGYIRRILEDGRNEIYSYRTIPRPDNHEVILPANYLRLPRYEHMNRDVLSALRNRCLCMKYDEIYQIEKTLLIFDNIVKDRYSELTAPPLQEYKRLFNVFEKVKWLKLHPKMPDANAEE